MVPVPAPKFILSFSLYLADEIHSGARIPSRLSSPANATETILDQLFELQNVRRFSDLCRRPTKKARE